jgi:hypothetical protein
MKLSDVAIDFNRVEQGEWVDNIPEMGDLRVKVRGVSNADWRRLQSKLIQAVPRNKRVGGQIDPEESDRITSVLLLETAVLDWSGIEDDSGNSVPYSKEQAREIVTNPTHRRVRDAFLWAASTVGDAITTRQEEQEKN